MFFLAVSQSSITDFIRRYEHADAVGNYSDKYAFSLKKIAVFSFRDILSVYYLNASDDITVHLYRTCFDMERQRSYRSDSWCLYRRSLNGIYGGTSILTAAPVRMPSHFRKGQMIVARILSTLYRQLVLSRSLKTSSKLSAVCSCYPCVKPRIWLVAYRSKKDFCLQIIPGLCAYQRTADKLPPRCFAVVSVRRQVIPSRGS